MENNESTSQSSKKMAVTRKQAASILSMSEASVDRLTRLGQLKPRRATRRPLYPIWELERFLRDNATDIS